jgi:hypothetical protein
MDPIDRLAQALAVDAPTPEETAAILQVARDVAHTIERRITPVSTYLLGLNVQRRVAAGATRGDALAGAISELRVAIPADRSEEAPGPTG